MEPLKIAVEYERGLHDATTFRVANVASSLLEHPLNQNEDRERNCKYFVKEGTGHQIEINSKAVSSITELAHDFLKAEEISDRISAELRVVNIPISETGAGLAEINPAVMHRVHGYQTIFGEDAVQRLIRISGIHIHIDQCPERLVNQFNALTALRPTIALTSTSSISHKGENSVNCHRYIIIADPVEGVFATIPEERGYITSMQDLVKRDKERHEKWTAAFANPWNRRNNPGLPLSYDLKAFLKYFKIENTGYPDIRNRPDIGRGTYELRINDTAPLDIVIAQAALVFGYNNRIMQEGIPVVISSSGKPYFHSSKIVLPSSEKLDEYTSLAVESGLQDPELNQYLYNLLKFAEQGLPQEERHYLDPFYNLASEGNLATQVLDYLGHKPVYSPAESALANQWMWERHRKSVADLQERTKLRN